METEREKISIATKKEVTAPKTEWTDPEFPSWSPDAQYIFQERLGILCGDTPFGECDPKVVDMARVQARQWVAENT